MNALDIMQSRYDDMTPVEPMEPSPSHYSEAFDVLVDDTELLAEFCEETQACGHLVIVQLMYALGLPFRDKTPRDDELIDRYDAVLTRLLADYRDWLVDNGKLESTAREVMREAIDQAHADAAEAAAEEREYMRHV